MLNPVLYPPEDSRCNSDRADGCPSFGEDSVLDRGAKGAPPIGGSIRPGLHRPLRDGPTLSGGTRPRLRWKWRSMPRFGISASWRSIQTSLSLPKASKTTPRGRRGGQICSAGPLSSRSQSRRSLRSLARKHARSARDSGHGSRPNAPSDSRRASSRLLMRRALCGWLFSLLILSPRSLQGSNRLGSLPTS